MDPVAAQIAAAVAGALAGFAAWRPGAAALVAAIACAVAAGMRLPETGVAAAGLAAATGLAALAYGVDRSRALAGSADRNPARGLAMAACGLALAASVAPAATRSAVPATVAAAALAMVLAAAASAAAAALAVSGRARHGLALVVALAPPGLAPIEAAAAIALDHPAAGARVVHAAHGPVGLADWSFAVWPWLVPLLLAAAVAWAWALHVRAAGVAVPARRSLAGLALATIAIVALGAAAWAAASVGAGSLVVTGGVLPDPVAALGGLALDMGPLAGVLGRLPLLGLLLAPATAHAVPAAHAWSRGLTFATGLALAGLWLATAGGWHGVSWAADPAARALLACILATACALAGPWRGPSALRDAAVVLALAAALSLVGGDAAGWRVAGRLLP